VSVVETVVAGGSQSLLEAYERSRSTYESLSCCDYSLRVVVTSWNEQVKQDMHVLVTDKGTTVSVVVAVIVYVRSLVKCSEVSHWAL